jgi:hypothetical protein
MSAQLHGGKFTVGGRGGVSRRTSIEHPASRGRGRARTIKAPASPTFRAPSGPAQVSLPSRRLPLYSLSLSLSPSTSPATYNRSIPYCISQPRPQKITPFRSAIPPAAAVFISPQPKEYEVPVHRAAHLESSELASFGHWTWRFRRPRVL